MALELAETDNITVGRISVAWHIVLASGYATTMHGQPNESIRKALTTAYVETYNAILANEQSAGNAPQT